MPALTDDASHVTELIVEAFYADPTWSWAFPDAETRRDKHRPFWRSLVDAAMRHRWVWLTDNEASTSVWIPPGKEELTESEGEALEDLIATLLGDGASRVTNIFESFAEAHHRHPEPHYYLSILATDPAQVGHGYGLGLLAANLDSIDAERMPAYLEASNPANVALYERYGFRVDAIFDVPNGGPTVTTMWRPAR